MAVQLCLRVFRDAALVGEHDFDCEMIKIGRLASAHLPLDEPKASRIHAVIHAEPSRISVVDMGSVEGTFLNGKRVNRATVRIGDEIRIGDTRIVLAAPRAAAHADPVPALAAPEPAPAGPAPELLAPPAESPAPEPLASAVVPSEDPEAPEAAGAPSAPSLAQQCAGSRRPLGLDQAVGQVGLQVRYYWGDTLLQVSQHARAESVFLGESRRSELRLAAGRTGAPDFELVSRSEDGEFQLNLADGMSGGLERDGERRGLGQGAWPLRRADFAWVELEGIRAELQFAPQPRRIPRRGAESIDFRFLNLLMALGLLVGGFGVSSATRVEADIVGDDLSSSRLDFAKVIFTNAKPPKPNPLLDPVAEKPPKQHEEAEAGERHRGREGKAGKESVSPDKRGRSSPEAIVIDAGSLVKRPALLDAVGGLSRGSATIFGSGGLGGELKGAVGSIAGAQVADAHGFGGWGRKDTGPGGGGMGHTVGIGAIGTPGRGGGFKSYGLDVGQLAPKRKTEPKIDDGGQVTVVGYDKELIRKVIHANVGQIRFCYEDALRTRTDLAGKVVVRFTIDSQGLVGSAGIAPGTTIEDPKLQACIRSRVQAWQFSPPKGGGEAIVTYPFLFKPSGE